MARKFSFDLYRLNIVDINDLFLENVDFRLRSDEDILQVIKGACTATFDQIQETRTAVFKWSLREFTSYNDFLKERNLCSVLLARSVMSKDGLIVTDDGIASGTSSSSPPLAAAMVVFFDLSRHLVAVENSGELGRTAWRDFIHKILGESALSLERSSSIELEPVPEKHGIIGLFRSFDRLTRLKVTLRIPNPELTRYTRDIYDDLMTSGVREYTQDMKNPNGLSKAENARPFASAALAEQGYKKGEVQLEGVRNDSFEKVVSGSTAARGAIRALKDFVRGMHANARAKETQNALLAIVNEIDKIHPKED